MQVNHPAATPSLGLRAGEVVEVRTEAEILATLDQEGKLDLMPFMPEMLGFCGKRFRVYKTAEKLCDTIESSGMRRMHDTVMLEQLRCDGTAHGGCQAGCLLLWKEAWLKRADAHLPPDGDRLPQSVEARPIVQSTICTREALQQATRVKGSPEEVFSCQATELRRATAGNIPWWDVRHYMRDLRAGNARPRDVVRNMLVLLFNKFQGANRRFVPHLQLIKGGTKYPFIAGRLTRTPSGRLDLQRGEVVRVKSKEEIIKTLDKNNRNRGLSFDVEMLRYCGREARVLDRVQRIINEKTGTMLAIDSDCIILEDMFCRADYHQLCPRSTYHYWREIWLERVR